jgi:transmembrane sensor
MKRYQYDSAGSPSDQAIEWLARLRADDVTPAETADFAAWLATSTLNKTAFDEATELWHQLSNLPVQQLAPSPQSHRSLQPRYRRILPLAAAASLLISCFVIVLQLTTPSFATGKGEQRRVVLADGSIAYLNTSSEISVNYSTDSRSIQLRHGEVWFDVSKQPDRPFVVSGRYATARAVGTAFTVRETPGFTQIGVTEGIVAVHHGELESQPHMLHQGEQSTVSTSLTDYQAYNADIALAWQRGQLIYDDVRLDELVADLNRYLPKNMTINDDSLVAHRVSAVLYLDDQDAMLEALAKTLPIRWQAVSRGLIIITAVD